MREIITSNYYKKKHFEAKQGKKVLKLNKTWILSLYSFNISDDLMRGYWKIQLSYYSDKILKEGIELFF